MVIKIFEKNMQVPFLIDVYGDLLSERKRELLDYYYNEDYSLSEISEITGISRQGIRDSVKKSEAELCAFEDTLGLVKRMRQLEDRKAEIKTILQTAISSGSDTDNRAPLEKAIALLDTLVL